MINKVSPGPLGEEDLPDNLIGHVHRDHHVILCKVCEGLGFVEREELVDYHRNEYFTNRYKCQKCNGDGRLISIRKWYTINLPSEQLQEIPYGDFHEIVNPHHYEDKWFRMRLDLRNLNLEAKYPKLAEVSYDRYDKLLKEYELLHKIETSTNETSN